MMVDFSQLNTVLLTILTLLGGAGVGILWNFASELVKVKVDIGRLQAEVESVSGNLKTLTGLFMEKVNV